jgi:hypothetical protein
MQGGTRTWRKKRAAGFAPLVEGNAADADVLLLAGDLTQHGTLRSCACTEASGSPDSEESPASRRS